ncbi:MAG: glutamate synthase large subunit [Candidatus Sumerlaeota bacterium]|nr:glutamate synthase large subunit [Candidatus Sumerlaeota bacterium]
MFSPSDQPRFLPPRQGLYDPEYEHDSCGVGFIATLKRERTHEVIQRAAYALNCLQHRGAIGGDMKTGDGAGMLFQVPHAFLRKACVREGIPLPDAGQYGVGMVFFPMKNEALQAAAQEALERAALEEGLKVLGWRRVPCDDSMLGELAKSSQPQIAQVFISCEGLDLESFERRLYITRKVCEARVRALTASEPALREFYICSLSARTIVYKGMFVAHQMLEYYQDLNDPDVTSALAMVHSRFSTNTLPSWALAHPFRYVAHNGEINTLRGNINNMAARQATMSSPLFGDRLARLFPIIEPGVSDSASFDNCFELLCQAGRAAPHALMMMIPEAWGNRYYMSDDKRAFYQFHSAFMEPWDGPAAVVFSDGRLIGGTLDRNGLRPCRYLVTKDGYVVLASETGVFEVEPANIRSKGRLQPGKMLLVDTGEGRIVDDAELKSSISRSKPYRRWLAKHQIDLPNWFTSSEPARPDYPTLLERQKIFGYTREELRMILKPMAVDGQEAVGSMGDDTPLAVLSERPQLLFRYFKQLFAQVTNPPIDPLREELVMSLRGYMGRNANLLSEGPEHCRMLMIPHPILTNQDMERLKNAPPERIKVVTLSLLFRAGDGAEGLQAAVDQLLEDAAAAVRDGGAEVLILSDRGVDRLWAPLPSLLAVGGVHHELIRRGLRMQASIVVETAAAREVHHFCALMGYGASAINPYLAFETIAAMTEQGMMESETDARRLSDNYIKAVKKGVLKTLSRMGISTSRSYRGAQIFEALGLASDVVERFFTGTACRIEGAGLDVIARETLYRHAQAYDPEVFPMLPSGGFYHWRKDGEHHAIRSDVVGNLLKAVRNNDEKAYWEFARLMDDPKENSCTLRSLFKLKAADQPVPLEEVEPATEIVKRFFTGAMSFGSIGKEAHECMAIAMNRIGASSNSGEGGEDPERYKPLPNGDSASSGVKQVASGRFGVTIEYLANARELQIKMAQGAKPGEGGQLPGHKVDQTIARVRHSTPGVSLISPPPHHDIYSIEDLSQLIFDLKNANPQARISVKLVSEVGVGTIAAGVAKAKADMVLISGHDGGTGASPLTSIKHAGLPWELGLAETQQALVFNHLRDRIRIQADGQMRTGRDVAIAALLGAEEYGFGTVALMTMGCCMLRKCHLNSCTVGVATQDCNLRKRFRGRPEHVIAYMFYVAEHTRRLMAEMGFRRIDEMIGHADLIELNRSAAHWKAKGLDYSRLLAVATPAPGESVRKTTDQIHNIQNVLDRKLIEIARPAVEKKEKVSGQMAIRNSDRTTGAMLSYEIVKRYGLAGLPDDTIQFSFEGSAGQSFGAFLARGVTLRLEGDANDYLGKGLSGGKIIVRPPRGAAFAPHENIIVGNTVLYGATSGEIYINGAAGERFAVRNSGARAVVEGVGDHCCEYMTGGVVVCLGRTGRNFAAGMSGGYAYVLDMDHIDHLFDTRCNLDMVDLETVRTPADIGQLRRMIEAHAQYTDSPLAREVLCRWEDMLPHFVKVVPIDYRKALERMRQDEQTHADTISSSEEVYAHG